MNYKEQLTRRVRHDRRKAAAFTWAAIALAIISATPLLTGWAAFGILPLLALEAAYANRAAKTIEVIQDPLFYLLALRHDLNAAPLVTVSPAQNDQNASSN